MKIKNSVVFITIILLVFSVKSYSDQTNVNSTFSGNPVIRNLYTADPAALVYNDTFFIFTGHDEQTAGNNWFYMRDWHVFSSTDMVNWEDHGACLSLDHFYWVKSDAWAGQCIERNGKFYWYVPMRTNITKPKTGGGQTEGFAIGVAVADHPTGPYADAIGGPLIDDNTPNAMDLNIDPTVFIDDDDQAYLIWGGWGFCRMVKLKDNMTELDGEVVDVPGLNNFLEAPYIHKIEDYYYLSYAAGWPETIQYAMSDDINGPWEYIGKINEQVSSGTNHQSIIKYKNRWYFVYHNCDLSGHEYRRSVCIDTLGYDNHGYIIPVIQTTKGVPEVIPEEVFISSTEDLPIQFFLNQNGKTIEILCSDDLKSQKMMLNIFNTTGLPIKKLNIYGSKTLSFSDLHSGYYILTVSSNNHNRLYSKKLFVQ